MSCKHGAVALVPFPFSALHLDPETLACEIRIAAAIQWYAKTRVSQDMSAEIAGLSRAAFIDALSAARVSPFQVDEDSLRDALTDAA